MPLYFAYGANMDVPAMARRCPASRLLGRARLPGHAFHIMPDGYASARPSRTGSVHGVLWDLALSDVAALDAFEEVAAGKYVKALRAVLRTPGAVQALLYLGTATADGPPRPGYLEAVIEAGRVAGLPPAYLRALASLLRPGAAGAAFDNGGAPSTRAEPRIRPRHRTPLDPDRR